MNTIGIKHIEFWVSNKKKSFTFYKKLFGLIGWRQIDSNGFSNGSTKIYFIEHPGLEFQKNIGPRHICFFASSKKVVDQVGEFLIKTNSVIIRGPLVYQYKKKYSYTIDFKDPDGYIIEVATKSRLRN